MLKAFSAINSTHNKQFTRGGFQTMIKSEEEARRGLQ
jgi:hypothetical protein